MRKYRKHSLPITIIFKKEFSLKFLKFNIMQVQVEIGFEQLVQLAKRLSVTQWPKFKSEVEKKNANYN